jgi:hypothetical protein
MSSANRNFVLAYVFLVILPLVGLVGILRSGRSLKAPASIDGVWSLQVDSAQLDSLPCGNILTSIPDKAIVISQSGRNFALSSPGGSPITGAGTLDGTTVRASLMPSPESPSRGSCGSERQLSLLATVHGKADSGSLVGTLSAPNCPTCSPVGFQALHQVPAESKGGR